MTKKNPETFVLGINKNQFIFVLQKPIKITIICRDIVNHDWLSGEGVLTLEPQCTLTGDNIHLNTHFNYQNNSEIVIPNLDIITDWTLSASERAFTPIEVGLSKIRELELRINETKLNTNLPKISSDKDLSYHDITHYSIFSFIFFSLTSYVFFRKLKKMNIKMPIIDQPLDNLSVAGENVVANI